MHAHPRTEAFLDTLELMAETHKSKGRDYGSTEDPFANIQATAGWGLPAWQGAAIRANDKIVRLQTYARTGTLAHEGARDAALDLAVYAAIAYVLLGEDDEDDEDDDDGGYLPGNVGARFELGAYVMVDTLLGDPYLGIVESQIDDYVRVREPGQGRRLGDLVHSDRVRLATADEIDSTDLLVHPGGGLEVAGPHPRAPLAEGQKVRIVRSSFDRALLGLFAVGTLGTILDVMSDRRTALVKADPSQHIYYRGPHRALEWIDSAELIRVGDYVTAESEPTTYVVLELSNGFDNVVLTEMADGDVVYMRSGDLAVA